MNYRLLVQI